MGFTIHQLEVLQAVVITGSFTKAGLRIGISQSSISQQLSNLEEYLGILLVIRDRNGVVSLTSGGEFWYRSSIEILGKIDDTYSEHKKNYSKSHAHVRLGITPNLKGGFVSSATRIIQKYSDLIKFNLSYQLESSSLAQQLLTHKVNFAILESSALQSESKNFHVMPIYEDLLTWVVPTCISDEEVRYALDPLSSKMKINPILRTFANVAKPLQAQMFSDKWFLNNLPFALGSITVPSFDAAIELAADGLATAHAPLSMVPNLKATTLEKIRFYNIKSEGVQVVIAMHKHLITHSSYSTIYKSLFDYCSKEHFNAMGSIKLNRMPVKLMRT
jgi:DNA-binding transcriptional LysR family regulator